MNTQELAIYREIQRNTEMAVKAIDTLSEKLSDDGLKRDLSRQSMKYTEIHNQALRQILDEKAQPYQSNHISDLIQKTGIHYNTLLNTSTGHIAGMMIRGSNNGILEMNRVLNHNKDAGEKPVELAKQLIDFEEKNVEALKPYL